MLSAVLVTSVRLTWAQAQKKIFKESGVSAGWETKVQPNFTRKAAAAYKYLLGTAAPAKTITALPAVAPSYSRFDPRRYFGTRNAKAAVPVAAAAPSAAAPTRGFFGRASNLVLGTPLQQAQRRLQRAERQVEAEQQHVAEAEALRKTYENAGSKFTNERKAAEKAKEAAENDLKAAAAAAAAAEAAVNALTPKTVGGRSRKNRRNSRKNRTRRNNY